MKRKLLSLLLIVCCMGATACTLPFGGEDSASDVSTGSAVTLDEVIGMEKARVEMTSEKVVAIRVLRVDGEENLLSVMRGLQTNGALSFQESGGMVMSINGKENAADWSACWMLYTSDKELANKEWGEVEYNGEKLGSAIVGAGELPVMEGAVYVWSYQSF